MNKDAFYFSHDSNARQDEKILALRMKLGWEGYGIYWAVVEKLREASDYILSMDYNVISFDLRIESKTIKSIVEDFGLFEFTEDGKGFYSDRMMRNMEVKNEKSQKARESAQKRWSKESKDYEGNANVMRTHNDGNAKKEKESKEKEIKKENTSSPKTGEVKVEKPEAEFYLTKKKRKLTGKRLESFLIFWKNFNYSQGKAEAADSWLDIPELTISLCEKINLAAEIEAKRRPELELAGKTPKMAQGWISSRRWEDEIYTKKQLDQVKQTLQRCER